MKKNKITDGTGQRTHTAFQHTLKPALSALTLVFAALGSSAAVQAQSLEQAVATTLTQNPTIREAYNEFKSREEDIDASQGGYLPALDVDAGIGYSDYNSDATKGTFHPREVGISLRQLIWDGAITYNDIKRTKSEAEAQRYQLLADAQDTALSVAEVYIDVLRAEAILDLSQKNLVTHERIYADIKKRTDSGLSSTADLSQADGRLAQAHSNLLSAQSNLQDAMIQFERVVGDTPRDLVLPEVDALFIPASLIDAITTAKENNPVIKVANNDVDAARYQYEQTKGDFYPTFTVEASQQWVKNWMVRRVTPMNSRPWCACAITCSTVAPTPQRRAALPFRSTKPKTFARMHICCWMKVPVWHGQPKSWRNVKLSSCSNMSMLQPKHCKPMRSNT